MKSQSIALVFVALSAVACTQSTMRPTASLTSLVANHPDMQQLKPAACDGAAVKVLVLGSVAHPGPISFCGKATLVEAVLRAGGLVSPAIGLVRISSNARGPNGSLRGVSLAEELAEPTSASNLADGDLVYISPLD